MTDENRAEVDRLMAVQGDMSHLETAFTSISATLDTLPPDRWPLFLAKLSLLLADQVGDEDIITSSVDLARRDVGS